MTDAEKLAAGARETARDLRKLNADFRGGYNDGVPDMLDGIVAAADKLEALLASSEIDREPT